jgi:hypothetical protein
MSDQAAQLQSLCEIIHVSVHRPRLSFKMKDATVEVDGVIVDNSDVATKPSWKLMPSKMESDLDTVENEVANLLARYAVKFRSRSRNSDLGEDSFQLKGLSLVPVAIVDSMLQELDGLASKLKKVVEDWTAEEGRLHDAIRDKVGDTVYALASKHIPTRTQLRQATGIDAVSIPIGAAITNVVSVNEREFLKAARERTGDMLAQITENLFAQPREELAEAVRNLKELIERDGRVTSRSIAPVRRAFEKLSLFDFVSDDTLREQIAALGKKLDSVTPTEQTKDVATSNGLLDALKSVHTAAISDASIEAQVQKYQRRIAV